MTRAGYLILFFISPLVYPDCANVHAEEIEVAQANSASKRATQTKLDSIHKQIAKFLARDIAELQKSLDKRGHFHMSDLVTSIDKRQLSNEAQLDFDCWVDGKSIPLPVERKSGYIYFFVGFDLGSESKGLVLYEAKIDDDLFETPPNGYQRMLLTALAFYNPKHKSAPIEIHRFWKYPWNEEGSSVDSTNSCP